MKDFRVKLPSQKFFRRSFGVKPIYSRAGIIAEEMIGQKYSVHMGNSARGLIPKAEIVNTAAGNYVFTKITGASIHKRKRKKKEKKKRGRK
jgi:ribosomal protein S19